MRSLLRTLAVAASGALAATLVTAAPASAVTTTDVNPPKLPRGADVSIPHLENKTVVDGTVRFRVKAPVVRLLGKSGTSYIVGTARRDGSGGTFHRYAADGTSVRLMRANIYQTRLSGDGASLVSARSSRNPSTAVSVWSATTGDLVDRRTFRDYVNVLDAEGTEVLVSGFDTGTRLWDTATDAVSLVTRRLGNAGDLSAGVLASFTKDPYQGGCSVVSSIERPKQRLWTSCTERVETFNADGTRMATVALLSDGIGPSSVVARTATGKAVGRYVVKRGWFGALTFETPTALLLETNGPRKAATVRCVDTACERASELSDTKQPRIAG